MGQVRETVYSGPEQVDGLRAPLEELFRKYGFEYVHSDPIQFCHRYSDPRDREIVAFLAATFAFGNVTSIFQTLERLIALLGPSPYLGVVRFQSESRKLNGLQHRWVTSSDISGLLGSLSRLLSSAENLEAIFNRRGHTDLKTSMASFSNLLRSEMKKGVPKGLTRGLRFLFPSPETGSGCKRMNLFLRWVVRREAPDLGLWSSVEPSELFLPIDTHMVRILRYIGLTERKNLTWKMVEEVTAILRRLDPVDPVRFDFSFSRLGILDQCLHRFDPVVCPKCSLERLCTIRKSSINTRS